MIGAIVGDVVGSIYEWDNIKTKDFELFSDDCFFTDDSVMTIAITKALLDCKGNYQNLSEIASKRMKEIGNYYPNCGYGSHFIWWLIQEETVPYNSYGNGAAMRVGACGYFAKSLEEALELSDKVTVISHNHPEGIKGARATTACIFLARSGKSIPEIRKHIQENYYDMNFTLDEIRPTYKFDVTCQGSVPEAIEAFLESTCFEDAIRNAISIGGDSDTIAAITGSIAQAYYGIPKEIEEKALSYLDERLGKIVKEYKETL